MTLVITIGSFLLSIILSSNHHVGEAIIVVLFYLPAYLLTGLILKYRLRTQQYV